MFRPIISPQLSLLRNELPNSLAFKTTQPTTNLQYFVSTDPSYTALRLSAKPLPGQGTNCSPSDAFLYSSWAKLVPTFHDTLLKMALISFLLSTSPSHLNHPKGVAGVRGPRDARDPFSPPPCTPPHPPFVTFFVALSKTRCGGHDNITSTLFLIWVTPPPPPLKYWCRFSNLY